MAIVSNKVDYIICGLSQSSIIVLAFPLVKNVQNYTNGKTKHQALVLGFMTIHIIYNLKKMQVCHFAMTRCITVLIHPLSNFLFKKY